MRMEKAKALISQSSLLEGAGLDAFDLSGRHKDKKYF